MSVKNLTCSHFLFHLHLRLNPRPDDVGLCSKLAPQPLVGLLSGHLLLEHLVSEGNKVLHLQVEIKQVSPEASLHRVKLSEGKLTVSHLVVMSWEVMVV